MTVGMRGGSGSVLQNAFHILTNGSRRTAGRCMCLGQRRTMGNALFLRCVGRQCRTASKAGGAPSVRIARRFCRVVPLNAMVPKAPSDYRLLSLTSPAERFEFQARNGNFLNFSDPLKTALFFHCFGNVFQEFHRLSCFPSRRPLTDEPLRSGGSDWGSDWGSDSSAYSPKLLKPGEKYLFSQMKSLVSDNGSVRNHWFLRSGRILPWRRRCPRHIHLPAVRRLPFVRMWKAFCRTLPLPPRMPTVTPPPAAHADRKRISCSSAQCRSVALSILNG